MGRTGVVVPGVGPVRIKLKCTSVSKGSSSAGEHSRVLRDQPSAVSQQPASVEASKQASEEPRFEKLAHGAGVQKRRVAALQSMNSTMHCTVQYI